MVLLFAKGTRTVEVVGVVEDTVYRSVRDAPPPTIYLPEHTVDTVNRLLDNFARLDRGRLPCDIVGVVPGDEIEFSRELVIDVVRTWHTIQALPLPTTSAS